MTLAEKAAAGDRLSLARLLTMIESAVPQGLDALDELYPKSGRAHLIGITGPSGSGKSTLVNRLSLALAGEPSTEKKVAIIAVDPTSPFSGGALLGDRVRMRDLADRPDIFIRSMATRGALGGLARAAGEAALLMDAVGFPYVLIETVGAGQSEVDIARLAHTTLVIEAPGLGDDVQAGKAGILEVADILVVNKCDKTGADAAAHSLAVMLEIGEDLRKEAGDPGTVKWKTPILMTSALNGEGITALADTIRAHHEYLSESGDGEKRSQARALDMLERLIRERLFSAWQDEGEQEHYQQAKMDVIQRKLSPRKAVNKLFSQV
jgi:LAO/AO transport system kinase